MKRLALTIVPLLAVAGVAMGAGTPAPKDAKVYIIAPVDGATVASPVKVVFGLSEMGVAPAGTNQPKTGHHHLLINTSLKDKKAPIPKDAKHVHFGGGQTETELKLEPGKHTLQLVLGDAAHIPHNPPVMSEVITIEVQ